MKDFEILLNLIDIAEHYLVGVTESDGEGIEPQLFVMDVDSGKTSTYVRVRF